MRAGIFFCSLLTACFLSLLAHGGMLREIELIDGSIIKAYVLSMDGKTYRLRSETLGEVEIPEYRVRAIREARTSSDSPVRQPDETTTVPAQDYSAVDAPDTASVPSGSLLPAPSSAADLQHAFSQDPTAMNKVLSLQDDPLVQNILGDEQLMQAIHSDNLGALMNDPRIQDLMSHQIVQDLSGQYGQ